MKVESIITRDLLVDVVPHIISRRHRSMISPSIGDDVNTSKCDLLPMERELSKRAVRALLMNPGQ